MKRLLWSGACALLLSAGLGGFAPADGASPAVTDPAVTDPAVTDPTVTGPVTGGGGLPIVFSGQPADVLVGRESFDLASVGYVQEEYIVDGTASAYSPAAGTTLAATAAGPSRRPRRRPTRAGSW